MHVEIDRNMECVWERTSKINPIKPSQAGTKMRVLFAFFLKKNKQLPRSLKSCHDCNNITFFKYCLALCFCSNTRWKMLLPSLRHYPTEFVFQFFHACIEKLERERGKKDDKINNKPAKESTYLQKKNLQTCTLLCWFIVDFIFFFSSFSFYFLYACVKNWNTNSVP